MRAAVFARIFSVLSVLALAGLVLAGGAAASAYEAAGPASVRSEDGVMRDGARDREVPYRLYRPDVLEGAHPLVIFSHGLGGSKEAAAYLGEHLASHGFLALHIQHPGSDRSVFEGADGVDDIRARLTDSIKNPRNALNRFRDIPFVIDTLEAWNADGALAGHIDLGAIGMSGHSYGARSTLIAAGEKIGRRGRSFEDERIAAAIAYSPNLPRRGESDYDAIDIPLMHVTGTADGDPLNREDDFDPARRTEPFARIDHRPQYLLVLDGADHMVFSGRVARSGPRARDADYWALTKGASLAFWKAHLEGDADALAFLNSSALGDDPDVARYEVKK